jgi:hypothetical protein
MKRAKLDDFLRSCGGVQTGLSLIPKPTLQVGEGKYSVEVWPKSPKSSITSPQLGIGIYAHE